VEATKVKATPEKSGLSKYSYGGCRGEDYVPYVPTTEVMPEITGYSVIMGILFALMFAAANTYLGLKVGMTNLRGHTRRDPRHRPSSGDLQKEQHPGSERGLSDGRDGRVPRRRHHLRPARADTPRLRPGVTTIVIVTIIGGLMGVFFITPVRRYLIVEEQRHAHLP